MSSLNAAWHAQALAKNNPTFGAASSVAQHIFAGANLIPASAGANSSSSTSSCTTVIATASVSPAAVPKASTAPALRVVHAYIEPKPVQTSAISSVANASKTAAVASGASATPAGSVAAVSGSAAASSSNSCPPIVVTAVTVTSAPQVAPGVAISSDWHWVNGVLVSAAPHHLDGREVSCERNGRRLGGEVMQVSAKGKTFTVEWYNGTTEKLSERAVKALLMPPPRVIDLSYLRSCKKDSKNLRHESHVGPDHQATLPPIPSDDAAESRKRARDIAPQHARDTDDVLVSSAERESAEAEEGECDELAAECKRERLE